MTLATFAVVVAVTAVQSLFGVGVLLFGTPLLLLLGHGFIDALLVLLPISVTINLLQIVRHHAQVDRTFYKHVLVYTIPFVVGCLLLVAASNVDMALPVGAFLLFVALERWSPGIARALASLVRYQRLYLVAMGVVHGLTNLGGSLLTAIVHAKRHPRDTARVTIAAAYCTFAVFQMATLAVSPRALDVPWASIAAFVTTGVVMFALTERFVYTRLDNERYRRVFAIFLAASGSLLIGRALLSG